MVYNINLIGQEINEGNILYPTSTVITEDSTIIYTTDNVNDILNIIDISQDITGDISYYTITKTFRVEIMGQWSAWTDYSIENLNSLVYKDLIYQLKMDILLLTPDFNQNIPFKAPLTNEAILNDFIVSYNNTAYTVSYNYPEQGDISLTIGYLNNGDYYIFDNTIEQKIFYKQNNYWISNKLIRTGVDSYIPIKFNNVVLTDVFIDAIPRGTTIPYNDYVLEPSEYAFTSGLYPKKGDNITIHSKYHYMLLNGNETIQLEYSEPVVVNPTINMGDISILYTKYIPVYSTLPLIKLINIGDKAILKPALHIKAYSISGFELDVNNYCLHEVPNDLSIKFRYTFDSKKLSTAAWHNLTTENLACIKGTPIKLFFVEFLFEKIGANNGYPFIINDLTLKGDIQILENDYVKSNRFGLRSDCAYNTENNNNSGIGECEEDPTKYNTGFTSCETNLWNPYDLAKPIALAEKLTNDISNQFGWEVDYYRLDPNSAGIDVFLHEYGVSDVVDKQKLKILIPDNKFPEDQIQFNMFDLALFDSFEIHITKQEYHNKFGISTRPANGDYLFICQINKLYQVEHAQSFRDFANSALYYKVTLTKKNNDKNIDNRNYTNEFESLISNNVTENLFGAEVMEQAYNVSDNILLQNVTTIDDKVEEIIYDKDVIVNNKENIISKPKPIVYRSYVQSVDYILDNITTVISQNYYDLSTLPNTTAIEYATITPDICSCCGISYSVWFNISAYTPGMIYNMFDISDELGYGMKFYFKDGKFYLDYFGTEYIFNGNSQIKTQCWFGIVLNIGETADLYVYKRDPSSPKLSLVINQSLDISPIIEYTNDMKFIVKGSSMKYTNMRLMKKSIPLENQNKFLNQYNIKNSGDLIIADNCVKQIYAKSFKF